MDPLPLPTRSLSTLPAATTSRAHSSRNRRSTNPSAVSARTRLAGVCWKVAELAKQQHTDEVAREQKLAIESLKALRVDLADMRDAPKQATAHFKLKTWIVIELVKLGLSTLGVLVGLSQMGYDVSQVFNPPKDDEGDECKTDKGGVAFGAVITLICGLSVIFQLGVNTWEVIHKIREQQQQDEEKRFISTMDRLLQNVEWLLEADKTNSTLCHKYIAACYKHLKELPEGYLEEHQELKTLITNLVALLPDEDELKRTLTDLGSTIHSKEKERRPGIAGSAPAGVFLDSTQADRASMGRHSTVFEVKPIAADQTALWKKLEELMGCSVDKLDFNGIELSKPKPTHVAEVDPDAIP